MNDWQAIVDEHGSNLWRTVFRLLNHHHDALDCCQEVLLDAFQYASKSTVTEWGALFTCFGTRRAIDRIRQRIRDRRVTVPLESVPEPSGGDDVAVLRAEVSEAMQRLREVLAELPNKQAEAFWLACVEGLSHDQISTELGVSQNESRVLVHRARSRLKAILDKTQPIGGKET